MTLTRRERLRRCYCHEETDRPGVYSRDGFPADDPTYDRLKAYLAAHAELKAGWGPPGALNPPAYESRTEPYSDDFVRRVDVLHTPKGPLKRTHLVSTTGQPGMHETFFLNSREDAEKLLSLPPAEWGGDVSGYFEADNGIGDSGIAHVGLGSNPGGYTAELFGSMNFALMCATDRDILHALCERHMNAALSRVKWLLSKGVRGFFALSGQEFIAPRLHGPRDFRDFNVRYDKPILDLIHDAGGRVHIHCHGALKRVFEGFLEVGTDVLHPVEPPPMGDITPAEAKQAARGRLCIEGNIQIADMYESTPEDVREQTLALIETVFDDRRDLIISPSASPYIRGAGEKCFPQYKAMVDAVTNWPGG